MSAVDEKRWGNDDTAKDEVADGKIVDESTQEEIMSMFDLKKKKKKRKKKVSLLLSSDSVDDCHFFVTG